jgi:hypothetical protein
MTPIALDGLQPERVAADLGGDLVDESAALAARIHGVVIVTVDDLERVVEARTTIADMVARVVAFFGPFKAMAHKLHRAICDRETEVRAPLDRLDAEYRAAIAAFKATEDRARRAREHELAEAQRVEREAAAAIEAAALETAGEPAIAAAVVDEAIAAPRPIIALPDVTKGIEGLSFARRWKWKYHDGPADVRDTPPEVLARALALMPREFLIVDEKKLGQYARTMKASARVPGIDFYDTVEPVRR